MAATTPTTNPFAHLDNLADTLKKLNLTQGEYSKIKNHLNRDPNFTELAMFSVLWSEHCCYKNSRHLLKTLPNKSPRVLHGPGENAGVVDIGDDIQIAFKIESHNHPTAVEPYQGAATGVGGILRDIFTMNARPRANLNALRFGPLTEGHNRFLFGGAVKGIGDYGNCVGVPTIGGEVFFDESYSGNPLVNAMAIGVIYDNAVMSSKTTGVGNPVLYVGSATGKDGMGGAAFASRELDEKSRDDRPAVQVGDPFTEKLLIEACLEAFQTGAVIAAQDMGAAGLTSSSCEMAAKGNVGMLMDLDKVPAREPGMQAWEFLLSESQERMLMVVEKGREEEAIAVFKKWNLPAVIVGEVTDDEQIKIMHHGQCVVDIPAKLLTDLAPSYDRGEKPEEPAEAKTRRSLDATATLPEITPADVSGLLEKLFASPNIAQAGKVFRQYDRHVQNNTLLTSDHTASGVIRIRDKHGNFSGKSIAATTDCNSRYIYLEPFSGTQSAVCEAIRNLACVGAEPLAVTDNLNFGAPEKPEIYYQMYYSVVGMKDACEAFKIPVISGNVSLYNEHSGSPILPAPVIGLVGLIENDQAPMTPHFKTVGDKIAVIGRFAPSLGGSEYQKLVNNKLEGSPPSISTNAEKEMYAVVQNLISKKLVNSVQDVSMGGLLTTLIECTFSNRLGISQFCLGELMEKHLRLDLVLFGESNGSYVISYDPKNEEAIKELLPADSGLDFVVAGTVSEKHALMTADDTFAIDLAPLETLWRTSLEF